jgi:hypothetical protein
MTLRSDDFEPSASASSASPPQAVLRFFTLAFTKLKGVIDHLVRQ